MNEKLSVDLLIFDLDGTLIDSSGDIAVAANRTLKEFGYAELSELTIKNSIGWGVKNLLERLMPKESSSALDRGREIFLEFYGEHLTESTELYPGTLELLEHFMGLGKNMAIVTNKPIALTERIVDEMGLRRFFKVVLGGDSLEKRKPDPDPLLEVLKRLDCAAGKAVFIGDSCVDCETGRRACVNIIGAAYGFRGRGEFTDEGCRAIIDSLGELKELLE